MVFSSPVLPDKTTITLSREKGTAACKVPKNRIGTVGPARAPFDIIDVGNLRIFQNMHEWSDVFDQMFLRPGELYSTEDPTVPSSDPFYELRKLIGSIFHTAVDFPEVWIYNAYALNFTGKVNVHIACIGQSAIMGTNPTDTYG